jgi:hypothetical protein
MLNTMPSWLQVSGSAWMSLVMSAFLGFLALTVVLATFYVMRSWSVWLGRTRGRRMPPELGGAVTYGGVGQVRQQPIASSSTADALWVFRAVSCRRAMLLWERVAVGIGGLGAGIALRQTEVCRWVLHPLCFGLNAAFGLHRGRRMPPELGGSAVRDSGVGQPAVGVVVCFCGAIRLACCCVFSNRVAR